MVGKESERDSEDEAQGEGKPQQQASQQQQHKQKRRAGSDAADERLRYIQQQETAFYYPQQLPQAAYQAYGYQYMGHPQQWASMAHHHQQAAAYG